MTDVVIVQGKRTPFGNFGGSIKDITTVELGAKAIKAALAGMPLEGKDIDQVIMGICLPGSGLSPCRQAIMAAGLPITTNALAVDRACCSAMSAMGLGFEKIRSGRAKVIVAGGMENMSQTPYLVPQMRWGARIGDITIKDELVIRNPYLQAPMAQYAGEVAMEWGVDRCQQDQWAVRSHLTWVEADKKGLFKDEVVPVEVPGKKGPTLFARDEHPRADTSMEALAKMKVVYGSPTVTAGNASGLCDGASATILMSSEEAAARKIKPLARIVDYIAVCDEPRHSPLLPAIAAKAILSRNNLSLDDMALIEINEAFASMPLVSTLVLADKDVAKAEKIRQRTNVNGGAISIGHPIGASGARIAMTLAYEMRRRGLRYGLACICGAIGQGDAVILEAVNS
jgi:acetyl-CoA C-acetyltransferase